MNFCQLTTTKLCLPELQGRRAELCVAVCSAHFAVKKYIMERICEICVICVPSQTNVKKHQIPVNQ